VLPSQPQTGSTTAAQTSGVGLHVPWLVVGLPKEEAHLPRSVLQKVLAGHLLARRPPQLLLCVCVFMCVFVCG
jgi:hypothetical protein